MAFQFEAVITPLGYMYIWRASCEIEDIKCTNGLV